MSSLLDNHQRGKQGCSRRPTQEFTPGRNSAQQLEGGPGDVVSECKGGISGVLRLCSRTRASCALMLEWAERGAGPLLWQWSPCSTQLCQASRGAGLSLAALLEEFCLPRDIISHSPHSGLELLGNSCTASPLPPQCKINLRQPPAVEYYPGGVWGHGC